MNPSLPLQHTYSAHECPVCKGICKFVQFNSLTPGEEIQKAVAEQKKLEELRKRLEQ